MCIAMSLPYSNSLTHMGMFLVAKKLKLSNDQICNYMEEKNSQGVVYHRDRKIIK